MNKQQTEFSFDFISITKIAIKWKKHLLIITILGAIAATIFTGPTFIKPKFKSTTIFYPSKSASVSQSVLNDQQSITVFGNREESEQLLQILNSEMLRDDVIQHFNLVEHYEIDEDEKYPMTITRRKYDKNVICKRTEYNAVEVEVWDTDPMKAANIANYISGIIDSLKYDIQRARSAEALKVVEMEYNTRKRVVDSVLDIMEYLRAKGIYRYFGQTDILYQKIVDTRATLIEEEERLNTYKQYRELLPDTMVIRTEGRARAARASLRMLEPQMELLRKYGDQFIKTNTMYEVESKKLNDLTVKLNNLRIDNSNLPSQKFMISKAIPAERRDYPKRMIMVLLSTFGVFILALSVLLAIEVGIPSISKQL